MEKALVIIPTYNERETLPAVATAILKKGQFHILVVDDGSPDGTADLVRRMAEADTRIFLLQREAKLGLGTAYVTGFQWGLERGYDYFIEMDADGSHNPDDLLSFIGEMEKGYGLVIGSRYPRGTISVVGWDFRRLLLSKFGNLYASWILSLRLADLTSGFRCFWREALRSIDLGAVHSNGYAFQIEMAYRISAAGHRVGEMPIIFSERAAGISKMSKKIVREAVLLPWRLRVERALNSLKRRKADDLRYNMMTVIGFMLILAGMGSGLWLWWWFSTGGDIIDVIHKVKMNLPGWAWLTMKVCLSAVAGFLSLSAFVALAVLAFSKGDCK